MDEWLRNVEAVFLFLTFSMHSDDIHKLEIEAEIYALDH